jgi:hypothetical protein
MSCVGIWSRLILITRFPALCYGIFIVPKVWEHFLADGRPIFHLFARPNTHPQNPLKLFWRVEPARTIAKPMSCKKVTKIMRPPKCVGKDVIEYRLIEYRLNRIAHSFTFLGQLSIGIDIHFATTEVTALASLLQYTLPFFGVKRATIFLFFLFSFLLQLPSLLMKVLKTFCQFIRTGRKTKSLSHTRSPRTAV